MKPHFKSLIITTILLLGTACVPELAPPQPPPAPTAPPTLPPTDTPSLTESPLATASPTASPTATASPSPTLSPTPTPTPVPTPTAIPTPTPTVDPNLDFDGDGFTTYEGDCEPRDPEIYPGAFDLPFDGQDGNCNGVQDQITRIIGATLNEGGSPLLARMDDILDIEIASDGTIYISDNQLCDIRRIKDDVITTLIGSGTCFLAGDGEHMSEAGVSTVRAMAIDERRERLFYSSQGEIWYLDLKTEIVHHFAGNRENNGVIEAIEGIPPDEVHFDDYTLAIDDRWGTLYFVSNYALFQLETDPQYYDRLQLIMGTPGEPGLPTAGPAEDSLMVDAFDLKFDKKEESFYLSLRDFYLELDMGLIAEVKDGTLNLLAGEMDDCYRQYKQETGDYGHPDTQENIEGLKPDEVMFCRPQGVVCFEEECYFSDDYYLYRLDRLENQLSRLRSVADYYPPGYIEDEFKAYDEGPLDEIEIDTIGRMIFDTNSDALIWSEPYNQIIRKMEISSTSVGRIAGYGPRGYYLEDADYPMVGSAADVLPVHDPSTGKEILYIADHWYDVISRYEDGKVTTVAGVPGRASPNSPDGPAHSTPIYEPYFLAADNAGKLYFYSRDAQIYRLEDGYKSLVAGVYHEEDGLNYGPALDVKLQGGQPMKYDPQEDRILILQAGDVPFLLSLEQLQTDNLEVSLHLELPTSFEFDSGSFEYQLITDFVPVNDCIYFLTASPGTLVKYDGSVFEVLAVGNGYDTTLPTFVDAGVRLGGLTHNNNGTLSFYDNFNRIVYFYRENSGELYALEDEYFTAEKEIPKTEGRMPMGYPSFGVDGTLYINRSLRLDLYHIKW